MQSKKKGEKKKEKEKNIFNRVDHCKKKKKEIVDIAESTSKKE